MGYKHHFRRNSPKPQIPVCISDDFDDIPPILPPDQGPWPCPPIQDFVLRVFHSSTYTANTPPSPPTPILLAIGGGFSYEITDGPIARFQIQGYPLLSGWRITCNAVSYNGGSFTFDGPPYLFFLQTCNPFKLHVQFNADYVPAEPTQELIEFFLDTLI